MQKLIIRQKILQQVKAKALIVQEDLVKVQQVVEALTYALLSELCERLVAQTGLVVSVTTMQRAVGRLK